MLLRVVLPLKRLSTTNFATREAVAQRFRSLGLELERRLASNTLATEEVRLTVGDSVVVIKIGSEEYYRELAKRNLSNSVPSLARDELAQFGLYFGAFAANKTYVGVCRAVESEVTVYVIQEKLETLRAAAEELLERLAKIEKKSPSPLFDGKRMFGGDCQFELYSAADSRVITSGVIFGSKLRRFWSDKRVEIAALLFSSIAAVACFLADLVPIAGTVDPLGSTLRAFVSKSWPSLFVSSAVLSVTLAVSLLKLEERRLDWKWK